MFQTKKVLNNTKRDIHIKVYISVYKRKNVFMLGYKINYANSNNTGRMHSKLDISAWP